MKLCTLMAGFIVGLSKMNSDMVKEGTDMPMVQPTMVNGSSTKRKEKVHSKQISLLL